MNLRGTTPGAPSRDFTPASVRPPEPRRPADPRAVLASIGEVVYDWDIAADAIVWGSSAAEVLGPREAAAFGTGAGFAAAVEGAGFDRAEMLAAGGTDAGTGIAYRLRYHLRLGDGRRVAVEDAGRWFADPDGRPALAHGALRLASASGEIDDRGRLLEGLREEVADALRGRRQATLLVVAPDAALDEAALDEATLVAVAGRIRSVMRRRERLVRYAGDRFAVLLASCSRDQAELAAARLGEAVARLPRPDGAPAIGTRIGAACVPDHALDGATLLRLAEDALARAAAEGSRLVVHRPGPVVERPVRHAVDGIDVLAALNDRRIALARQPIVEAASRAEAFAEALVRVRRPDGRLAPGREVMPSAERAGLAALVDARVLELAAEHLGAWPSERLAINVAAETIGEPDWLSTLAAHLGARPGIASRLVLEIPEAAFAGGVERLGARLDAMKALGVGVAVAGFGGGRATLGHLNGLPVDVVKIDGAFVQNLARSPDDRLLVRALVDLAHHLDIATVAEWVEDEATATMLAGWGVDFLQGELFGAPAALELPAPQRRVQAR